MIRRLLFVPRLYPEEGEFMGEVRVQATLTNAVDEELVRQGLLTSDKVRRYEAKALAACA